MAGTIDDLPGEIDRATALLVDLDATDHRAAQVIARNTRPPRRTGRLASSVRVEGPAVVVDAPYGLAVHQGVPSHHQRAQPFLSDAAERSESEIADVYLTHAADALGVIQ